jgi:aspartyl-tRNA(Asn)/glutamyl-tRNA(Gln) amidotransferase subunit A
MADAELAFAPASRLLEMMDGGEVSSVELTEMFLGRIAEFNPRLNAYLTVSGDEAMAQAREADAARARGERGALLGLPTSIKDLEATKGIRSTMGSLVFNEMVPDRDSVVVERVKAAGGVILGKTNTPEFGLLGITQNRLGDPCCNPWDPTRTSGGSSGGAAAAVIAGLSSVAPGTDGGGSVRLPSSFCGLYGLKPTLGRVPRGGGFGKPSPNLTSQAGPMARTVRDAALLLQVLAGRDSRDASSLRSALPDYSAGLGQSIQGLRIAWSSDLGYCPVDPQVLESTAAAAQFFQEFGCQVEETNFALDNPLPPFYDIFYSNNYTSWGHLLDESPDELTDYGRTFLEHGSHATGVDYARALAAIEIMKSKLADLLDRYDLLMTPTVAVPAFPHGQFPTQIGDQVMEDPRRGFSPYTRPFNVIGSPAASIPCGMSSDGLPIGLHIIGRHEDEATVLRASAAFEQARPWPQRPPIS